MITELFVMTLIWMRTLSPGRDVNELAWAVASVAESREEAALLTAIRRTLSPSTLAALAGRASRRNASLAIASPSSATPLRWDVDPRDLPALNGWLGVAA